MTPMSLVLGALATWRMSHMFLYESGPWAVFRRIRRKLGTFYNEDGKLLYYQYEITVCVWCISMWVGFGWGLAFAVNVRLASWLSAPFVFSAVAAALDNRLKGPK